jgi:hypothetical protein
MLELGRVYRFSPLTRWASELKQQAELFDMDALSDTLHSFPKIINLLESSNEISEGS